VLSFLKGGPQLCEEIAEAWLSNTERGEAAVAAALACRVPFETAVCVHVYACVNLSAQVYVRACVCERACAYVCMCVNVCLRVFNCVN